MFSSTQTPLWILLLSTAACGSSAATGDPQSDTDASVIADDAGVDAASAFAHCSPPAAIPTWVETDTDVNAIATCSSITLRLTAFTDGVFRLSYTSNASTSTQRASWAITEPLPRATQLRITSKNDALELCTPDAVVHVAATTCATTITDRFGQVLLSDSGASDVQIGADYSSVTRHTPSTEQFYGFGEKTGPLNKRGTHMTFWNTDAYDPALGGYKPDQDPLYLSIPFFVGLRNGTAYGVFTDSAARVEMDMAKQFADRYQVTVHDDAVDQYVVIGPAMAEVTRRYTRLTGRMKLPPRWTLGYHQSRWGYDSTAVVDQLAARFRSDGIPADAIWLDIEHMNGYRSFTWDPVKFPNPAAMIDRLADSGFKVIAIADPGIKVDDDWDVYTSGRDGDHFVRAADGTVYEGIAWPGASSFPDFSNPATRAWWAQLVQADVGVGLRGIWLDVNEPTVFPEGGGEVSFPGDALVNGNGVATTMARMHNAYASVQAQATYDGMLAAAPGRRPFILSRAGYAGIQRYAATWTGDVVSDWNGLVGTVPMLLNMGLSGVVFTGSDVGGYSGHATPELFARWMALGSISPFFRGHVTSNVPGQEPWQFGTEVRDISRELIGERYRLLPYYYSLMRAATVTGAPVLRPLVYDFQDDPMVTDIGDQAMVGPFILAAPVLTQGATMRTVRLPKGRWFDYYSGAIYDGPATIEVDVTLAALPLFARAGAIIPRGPVLDNTDGAASSALTLELYPAAQSSSFTVYDDAGDGFAYVDNSRFSEITYELQQTATGARLTASVRAGTYVPSNDQLTLRLRRADSGATAVTNRGIALPKHDTLLALQTAGHGWWFDATDLAIVVELPKRDNFDLEFAYDTAITELSPPVDVVVEVRAPPGTPTDTPLYIATSASGWIHQPLTWTGTGNIARGVISVPRGSWFHYKFSRGDWDTVEKWPGCAEAANRYRLGSATRSQTDTVFGWRDWCP